MVSCMLLPAQFHRGSTTHQRADALKRALEQHMKYLPAGALVVVIDDGSKPAAAVPDGAQLLRHESSFGIVASKNVSLTALMNSGCEHIFLWEDDAWPIAYKWHLPYIESPELHLAYQFLDLAGNNKLKDIAVLYLDEHHVAYTGQRSVMLYFHRIERAPQRESFRVGSGYYCLK